jgi:AMMECR1 domain-containing protein
MPKPKQRWKNKSRIRRAMMKAKLWYWVHRDMTIEIQKRIENYFSTVEI